MGTGGPADEKAKAARTEGVGEGPTLPYSRAFVVQFAAGTGPELTRVAGRVEHLRTGRRAKFASIEDLLACIETMLADADPPQEEMASRPDPSRSEGKPRRSARPAPRGETRPNGED